MDAFTAARADSSPADRVLAIVRQLVAETHPGSTYEVTLHTSFERDLALDSLARVELMLRIGKAFSADLPQEALSQADTPGDVLRLLGQSAPAQAEEHVDVSTGARMHGFPEHAQTLLDVLEWHAERQPEQLHILLHDEQHREHPISYRALLTAARAIAAGLARRGLQPRQTVALMLPTGRDYLASFFGVLIAGGIPVPIYPPARLSQIEDHLKRHARILGNAEAALIITVEQATQVAMMLRAAVPSLSSIVTPAELNAASPSDAPSGYRPGANDIAFLQYTSGSTGDPKGVMLTHANLLANIRVLGQVTRATPDDVFVSWLPLYHDMGLIGAWFGTLYHGMTLVLMSPLAFLARPALWLETISRHRGSFSAAPNFAYELCVRHIGDDTLRALDLSSWRVALNGAEPVSPATLASFIDRFAACGLRREAVMPVYGLAESSVGLAFPPLDRGPRIDRIERDAFARERKAVPAAQGDGALAMPSCGRPLPGHDIRIVDDAGYECAERQVGRLEFRGPSATSGYYRNPQATAKLFRDGWLDSGDHAYLAEGEIFITGRVKDLIKRGGRNLYPYDLEQAVGNLPGIRKGCVAVFSSKDRATDVEKLVIVAETRERDEATRGKLRRTVDQAAIDVVGARADDVVLAPPHAVLKTSSGKIRRIACREAYERGELGKPAAAPWRQKMHLVRAAVLARVTVLARRIGTQAYGAYAWAVFFALALPAGVLVALAGKQAFGRRIMHAMARAWCRLAAIPLGVRGVEKLPRQPHVLLVNHASYLDSILLTALLPPAPGYAFVGKRELLDLPLGGRVLRAMGTIFVQRFDARHSMQDVDLMVAALERGDSIVVFPEGTMRREAGLRPFHAGAFIAAGRAGVPVVVAGLRGVRNVLREGSWTPHRAAVGFEVGPTLAPAGADWAEAAALSTAARKEMVPLSGEFALS